MPGGLMNIASYGNENIILTGNPTKTFFKATYHKHTNFGMQKFRIDYKGLRTLNYKQDTVMDFKIPRYAELLNDTYIVITMPDIWSPFHFDTNNHPRPLEFRWIENLGAMMIKNIEIHSGGNVLSRYSGEYLHCLKERDFTETKKKLWNEMTGCSSIYTNPALKNNNTNMYPNAYKASNNPIEPSIRGDRLYIPLGSWFSTNSKQALPLVSLQYQVIFVKITFNPIRDLYTILDVENMDMEEGYAHRISPNVNNSLHQLWRYLQPPLNKTATQYANTRVDWNADVHLIGNYIFLSNDERRFFAQTEHKYLVKQVYEYEHLNSTGSRIVDIESNGMVSGYMWRFRRSDAHMRNEWSNYTNWPYKNVVPIPTDLSGIDFYNPFNYEITGDLNDANKKMIMEDLAILADGTYRENIMKAGVFNYIEKYIRTDGCAEDGLYVYNFSINSNKNEYQPSGAFNTSKFKYISFEFNTIQPPVNPETNDISLICDDDGEIIGVRKNVFDLNEYNFDLKIFEERYNVIIIKSGNIGLLYAR